VEVGSSDDRPWRGETDPAARRLREPDPAVADFRLRLDHRELDGGEGDLLRLELRPVAEQAPAALAVVDDLGADNLDPGAELVGLAERIPPPELVEVREDLRRRLVGVRDGELERDDRDPVEGLERQPCDRRCGGVDPHQATAFRRSRSRVSAASASTASAIRARISSSVSPPSSKRV
jgi:hypothetical protein